MPPQAPVHVLIIGAGAIGALWDTPEEAAIRTHAHAVTNHPGFRLLGFVEPDAQRAATSVSRWGGQVWNCLDTAMRDCHALDDCLYILPVIASPDVTHAPLLRFLLHQRWPKMCGVIVEKPLTTHHNEAEECVVLSRKRNLPVWVNYPRAFLPPYQALRETCQTLGPWRQGTLRYGKGLWHNGSHGLQLWQMLTGVGAPCEYEVTFKSLEAFNDWAEGHRDPSVGGRLCLTPYGCPIDARWLTLDPVPANRGVTVFELDLIFEDGRVQVIDQGQHLLKYRVGSQSLSPNHRYYILEEEVRVDLSQAMAGVYQRVRSELSHGKSTSMGLDEAISLTSWLSAVQPGPLTLKMPIRSPSSMGNPFPLT